MPAFATEVPHQLGKAAAVEKLKGFLTEVQQRYAKEISTVEGEWADNLLTFKLTTYGFKIDGKIVVEEELIRLEGNLPLAATIFKGKITESIRVALEKAVASDS